MRVAIAIENQCVAGMCDAFERIPSEKIVVKEDTSSLGGGETRLQIAS
jgi:hypothetical protein